MRQDKDSLLNHVAKAAITGLVADTIKEVASLVATSFSSIIDIGQWDSGYDKVNDILYNLDRKSYNKYKVPTSNKSHHELTNGTSYIIRCKPHSYILVSVYRNAYKGETIFEKRLKISFYGSDRRKIHHKFMKSMNKLTDTGTISLQYMKDNCRYNVLVKDRGFDTVVLRDDIKNRILKGLLNWKSSKQWYNDHQLTYKIGVLLYGPPGTGKTTIIRAISTEFGDAPIFNLDTNNLMMSILQLNLIRNSYTGTFIVMIEDFDMMFHSPDEDDNSIHIDSSKIDENRNAIFQLLDGLYSTEDTIYVATTNHIERLGDALIRAGRFDIVEEIPYFEYKEALRLVQNFGYDEAFLNLLSLQFPVQPSLLQSKIMEYRSKN